MEKRDVVASKVAALAFASTRKHKDADSETEKKKRKYKKKRKKKKNKTSPFGQVNEDDDKWDVTVSGPSHARFDVGEQVLVLRPAFFVVSPLPFRCCVHTRYLRGLLQKSPSGRCCLRLPTGVVEKLAVMLSRFRCSCRGVNIRDLDLDGALLYTVFALFSRQTLEKGQPKALPYVCFRQLSARVTRPLAAFTQVCCVGGCQSQVRRAATSHTRALAQNARSRNRVRGHARRQHGRGKAA